jgi:hypothetical protein
MPKIKTEVINGVTYQNVFGLLHRIPSEEEMQQLDPTMQFLERTGKDIVEKINERADVEEKSKPRQQSA